MDAAEIGRQIKKAYPEYSQYPDELLGQRYLLKNKADTVFSATEPKKALEEAEAQADLGKIEAAGGGITAKEAKAKEVIDQLFELYYGKPGEQSLALVAPGEYRLGAQWKVLETKFKAGEANSIEERIYKYNRILESKRAQLAKSAGDSGNLALQEQILAGRGLPGGDSTPNEASGLFASAYDVFAGGKRPPRLDEELMLQEQGQQQTPQTQTGLSNIPQEGLAMQTARQRNLPNIPQPNALEKMLLPIAQGPIGGLADIALNLLPEYKKAIQKSAKGEKISLGEGIAAGGDIATTAIPFLRLGKLGLAGKAALAGGVRGATRDIPMTERQKEAVKEALIGGVLGNILKPMTIPSTIRDVGTKIAKNPVISLKPAIEAGKGYVKRVPIADNAAVKKTLISLSKEKSARLTDVFEKLSDWGPLTYKKGQAGIPKDTATAQFYSKLYGSLRNQVAQKAPIASIGQTGISKVKGLQDIMDRALKYALIGGAFGAGGAAIGGGIASKMFPGLTER